jgi:DNA-binding LytR/AlgR family response regulator
VAIHTTTNGKILTLQSIRSFQEQLPESNFMRVHKSYLVALDKIQFIERNRIVINENYIPVGETYQEAFQQRLKL